MSVVKVENRTMIVECATQLGHLQFDIRTSQMQGHLRTRDSGEAKDNPGGFGTRLASTSVLLTNEHETRFVLDRTRMRNAEKLALSSAGRGLTKRPSYRLCQHQ